VSLPYLGTAGKPSRDEIALFEVRGTDIRADKFDAVAIQRDARTPRPCRPATTTLWLKRTGERIRVRVASGAVVDGQLLNPVRHSPTCRAQARSDRIGECRQGVSHHPTARRFPVHPRPHLRHALPAREFPPFADLAQFATRNSKGCTRQTAESIYLTGRNIGDEYRYVLERRAQKKYPGNMLERPSLLLNPWAVRTTETGEQLAQGGDKFGAKGGGMYAAVPQPVRLRFLPRVPHPRQGGTSPTWISSTMPRPWPSTSPDKEGVIKLPRK
jgi:hypothetical protein